MNLDDLFEAIHSYDTHDYNTAYQPVKLGDTFRVYHGFRDFSHAVALAHHGLSGKERADRTYSYEGDNNPNGLFVTLSFKIASEFVGGYDDGCIIEFVTTLDELEPPVWPGGSYTVQGQMSQYFGHGAKGRMARRQAMRDREAATVGSLNQPDRSELLVQSDRKYLADLLLHTREHQALFVGDLNPNRVTFHVTPKDGMSPNYRPRDQWERLSLPQFLERVAGRKVDRDRKAFEVDEDFNGEVFLPRLAKISLNKNLDQFDELVGSVFLSTIQGAKNPVHSFLQYFGQYLWPRQYRAAFLWMKNRYGKKSPK